MGTKLNISETKKWNEVMDILKKDIEELLKELPDLNLWSVKYITIGFTDGDLSIIKTSDDL